ncbi:terminase [Chroococcidiopsis sp.]|uniref:phage terminase large subunit family protein n=1 Tax=Chroococcidiopsis sp. TaxID=3088168 RepID=UPI003F31CD20
MLARSAKDICFWINTFSFTYDPRRSPATIPFELYPIQEKYLKWRQQRRQLKEHGIVEKSRDMGVSWLNCAAQLHAWLFEPGYAGIMGSRKELLVDRLGDPSSLFQKIRMMIDNLPYWMLPRSHVDGYLKLINNDNGATITGEAGSAIGRGSRAAVVDLDEAAFLERSQLIDAAVSQTSEVVIYTSTPNGSGNSFYQKRFSNKYPVFTFHWKSHPLKDQQWYEKQKAMLDPVIVATEIDIDYSASIEGIFIEAKWVRAAINYPLSGATFRGEDSPRKLASQGAAITAGLDVATTGKNKNVFVVRQGCKAIALQDWQGLNTTETTFKAQELIKSFKATHLNFDVDGVGAGVAGTLETTPDIGFTFNPVHGAGSPSDRFWVGEDKTSKEKFHNRRAEHYGLLRERFRKTYEMVEGIAKYPENELISIPNHATLIAQLSQPLRKFTSSGKILLESKDDMRRRGNESPDYADALMYAFIDPPEDWAGAIAVGETRAGYALDW